MMQKNLAGVGLLTIGVGGVIALYYYLKKMAPCVDGNKKCIGADLYTCVNGDWQLTQINSSQCQSHTEHCLHLLPGDDTGYGYPTGWRKCDPITNELCEWNNSTKKWNLVEENSYVCLNNIEQQKCYVATNTNYVTCGLYAGTAADECWGTTGYGCSCYTGNCRPECWCCSDHKCQTKAESAYLFYINRSSLGVSCWEQNGAQYCQYDFTSAGIPLFQRPLAFKSLIDCKIYYEWGPIPCEFVGYAIWGHYNNQWYLINEGTPWLCGSEGIINVGTISLQAPVCIDKIQIGLDAISNIRMKAMECKFAFL